MQISIVAKTAAEKISNKFINFLSDFESKYFNEARKITVNTKKPANAGGRFQGVTPRIDAKLKPNIVSINPLLLVACVLGIPFPEKSIKKRGMLNRKL
ncbi:MAG: hypothetical protein GX817_06620 [Elusimicrobia bacterium]|nr:hypothetical protein [Elusimicrobiota bacterium]